MNGWLLLIPILSTFSGWLVSRIAIGMLLYPNHSKKIFGITFQGILPKCSAEMAKQLAELVTEQLFSQKEIEHTVIHADQFEKLLPQIEHHIDEFLRHRVGKKMPMIGMFIGENTIRQLKEVFMEELKEIFPAIMGSYINNIQQQMDFKRVIVQKINSFPISRVKPVFNQTISKDVRVIIMIGSIIGFVMGIIQVLIMVAMHKP